MNKEDKEILLKDLCARLPYGVKIEGYKLPCIILNSDWMHFMYTHQEFAIRRPYLRPMSSMTEEEKKHCFVLEHEGNIEHPNGIFYRSQDYLNSIHVDYRGLIEKGLALEAPEGMYKLKRNSL